MDFFALMMFALLSVVTIAWIGELVSRWLHGVRSSTDVERYLGRHQRLEPFRGTIVWPVSVRLTQKVPFRPRSKG